MTGALNMGTKAITNLATPSAASDLATKDYIDTLLTAGAFMNALSGDVSATGPAGGGSAAATVDKVGTSTAANIHLAELLANAATSSFRRCASRLSGRRGCIVKRESSSNRPCSSGARQSSGRRIFSRGRAKQMMIDC